MDHRYLYPSALFLVFMILLGTYVVLYRVTPVAAEPLNTSGIVSSSTQQIPADTGKVPEPASATYTMTEVASHSAGTSCWTAINGGVYDVTSWISVHPGGTEAIMSLCGTDGSVAFNGQHGGQGRPASELKGFKIGEVRN